MKPLIKFTFNSNCRTNKDKLGNIGEQIVSYYIGGTLSENKFDDKKDLVLDTLENCEVKTQSRHTTKNVFSIRAPSGAKNKNQIFKCQNVERLYFIEYNLSDKFRIYECHDRDDVIEYTAYMGPSAPYVKMLGWDINKMSILLEVEDAHTCSLMRTYSQSNTLMKDFPQ